MKRFIPFLLQGADRSLESQAQSSDLTDAVAQPFLAGEWATGRGRTEQTGEAS